MKIRNRTLFETLIVTSATLSLFSCEQNCESPKEYTVQGTITERVSDTTLEGIKVYIACMGPLDDLQNTCGLLLWRDSAVTDNHGKFSMHYPGGKKLEGKTGSISFITRGWDCTGNYGNLIFDSPVILINLYADPRAFAVLNFHNTSMNQTHGARIVLGCNQQITISNCLPDTTVFCNIAGAWSYKFDWMKTQDGYDVATVSSNDSVYVAPGDTITLSINY